METAIKNKELFWRKQIEIEERQENKLIVKLRELFDEQKEEVLKKLRETSKLIELKTLHQEIRVRVLKYRYEMKLSIPSVLPDPKKEGKKFAEKLKPILQETVEDAGKYALNEMGITEYKFEMNEYTEDFLKTKSIKFAIEINEKTKKDIREQLDEGMELGEGINKLAERIEEVYVDAEGSRAFTIARTETARTVNAATNEAYRQSGVVQGKEWLCAFDETSCETCKSMSGREIDLDDNFFDKGDEFQGIKLDYEDIGQPPLHVNCRCTIIPIIEVVNGEISENQNGEMICNPTTGKKSGVEEGDDCIVWQPTMLEKDIKRWNKNSEIKDSVYHGTSKENADSIIKNGFKESIDTQRTEFGNGIYFTLNKKNAVQYSNQKSNPIVLEIKTNVNKIGRFKAEDFTNSLFKYADKYRKENPNTPYREGMNSFNDKLRKTYDAIIVDRGRIAGRDVLIFNPKNVTVVMK